MTITYSSSDEKVRVVGAHPRAPRAPSLPISAHPPPPHQRSAIPNERYNFRRGVRVGAAGGRETPKIWSHLGLSRFSSLCLCWGFEGGKMDKYLLRPRSLFAFLQGRGIGTFIYIYFLYNVECTGNTPRICHLRIVLLIAFTIAKPPIYGLRKKCWWQK